MGKCGGCKQWVRTTSEMEEILDGSKGQKGDGSWDPLYDSLYDDAADKPDEFYLTNYVATDDTFILVFSNGHMELVGHPETGDFAHDGDYWDVSVLGWA